MERALKDSTPTAPILSKRLHRRRGTRGGRRKKKKVRQLSTGLFNLAGVDFSSEELEVMAQGLKFAPDKYLDKFETYTDIEKYARKLNIKKHFCAQPPGPVVVDDPDGYAHSGLKNNSVFNPKKTTYKELRCDPI